MIDGLGMPGMKKGTPGESRHTGIARCEVWLVPGCLLGGEGEA